MDYSELSAIVDTTSDLVLALSMDLRRVTEFDFGQKVCLELFCRRFAMSLELNDDITSGFMVELCGAVEAKLHGRWNKDKRQGDAWSRE
jgi:hypothetical protein